MKLPILLLSLIGASISASQQSDTMLEMQVNRYKNPEEEIGKCIRILKQHNPHLTYLYTYPIHETFNEELNKQKLTIQSLNNEYNKATKKIDTLKRTIAGLAVFGTSTSILAIISTYFWLAK